MLIVASTGGGSRHDILSLVILRPVAVLGCAFAAWRLAPEHFRQHRFAFGLMAAVVALTLMHLVPLPPAIWQALPGRDLIVDIDAGAGLVGMYRPVSLAPPETRNALFSLFVPLAILLGGAGLERPLLERLLLVVVMIGLVSGVLGLLQLADSPTGPLFLYRHTNYGAATGLFANRNHQAVLLATLFPMLAVLVTAYAHTEHAARVRYGALAAGVFLIPLLLITGSRAGIVAGVLGLASIPFLLRAGGKGAPPLAPASGRRWLRSPAIPFAVGMILAIGLAALTIGLSRAESVDRLFAVGTEEELRFKVWPVIAAAIPTYLPIGSGIGSFAPVFQIVEPDRILRPTYLNHAHNEVLEVLLTAGLPGAALMLAAAGGWIVAAGRAFRMPIDAAGVPFARLGIVVIGLLAIGSIGDYPMRTPLLAALLALATLWSGRLSHRSVK
ncbi:O-antigen ligase family protein [uncultured Sphingomonas sp.]|uniref:O-antigen ligase family protein n=1 Tax=uncultured Sphingomonas sp. TaxID=158754 RepID=UPI0035CB2397